MGAFEIAAGIIRILRLRRSYMCGMAYRAGDP
jgi:hypothetical protein